MKLVSAEDRSSKGCSEKVPIRTSDVAEETVKRRASLITVLQPTSCIDEVSRLGHDKDLLLRSRPVVVVTGALKMREWKMQEWKKQER